MRQLRQVLARLRGALSRTDDDAELREELESHLEMEAAEYVRRGMNPLEARRKALLASGGLTAAAESVRAQRGLPWIESIAADARFALRALRRSPAFTLVVILTLALGIGANTAIFSVVRGVLLKPLPHRDGDRLLYLRHTVEQPGGVKNVGFSVPEVTDFRIGARSLGGIAEYSAWFDILQERESATRLDVGLVTGNFFEVMGLAPVLGRVTRPSDDGAGVPAVMVLSHDFWKTHFGGDSSIVGKQVRIDGASVTVIGVLQPAPFFPDRADAFLNMVTSPHHLSALMTGDRSHRMTEMIARLAPGSTLEQARAEVAAVEARVLREHADAYDPVSHDRMEAVPFKEALGERARLTLWLLMAAAGFVMIISVANVVNLTLMRGVRREHELVVRSALGAGTGRLRRLLLVENLMLTLGGALLGVLIAAGGLRLLTGLAQRYSPRANEIRLDGTVLAFTVGLSVLVALLLSFAAFLPRDGAFAAMISAGLNRIGGGVRRQRLQRGLVIAQVAVSVVLLAGAGLLTRTMVRLSRVDTGLRAEEVLTIPVPILNPAHVTPEADAASKQMYSRMQREIRALPGVREVGLGSTMPLRASLLDFDVNLEGRVSDVGQPTPHADFRTASPEYFRAAGIPLEEGREFTVSDWSGSPRVVLVNRALADRYFPGESPIGKRIAWTGRVLRFTPVSSDWRTIVGVVGSTQDGGLDAERRAVVFAPFSQEMAMLGGLVIRADSDAAGLVGAASRIIRRVAPGVPVEHVLTVAQIRDESVAPRRLNAALVSMFGILAVLIAAVGIAGVLAFSVSARTTEIGIRMSLGADPGQVQRMILGEGGVLLLSGLVAGTIGAFLSAGLMRGLLFGVDPHDATTLVAVVIAMGAMGLGACWIPARRASRIDPAITIRQ